MVDSHYPKPQDQYPILYLKDTDTALPVHVVNNKSRYGAFTTVAKGGKCIIRSCQDFHLRRVVAYKSLRPELADDPFENRRFLREARVTAMLQHPNTIPVYELSRDTKGHYYFTMKFVHGSTLREIVEGDSDADIDDLIDVLIQVCHALDYAHNHGVVHRDVKPSNILVGPFGEVLLLDWGLAKVWGMNEEYGDPTVSADPTLTGQGSLQGTVLYMSPEQIEESPELDHRSDIYSIGTVLYEVLTGITMIESGPLHRMMTAVRDGEPIAPSERAPAREIPAALEEICLRCVARNPEDRYPNARDLLEALQAWSDRTPTPI